jgi:hypothetical protein
MSPHLSTHRDILTDVRLNGTTLRIGSVDVLRLGYADRKHRRQQNLKLASCTVSLWMSSHSQNTTNFSCPAIVTVYQPASKLNLSLSGMRQ